VRTLVIMLFAIASSVAVSAQPAPRSTDAPEVVVVKFSWSKERVGWQADPFGGPLENFDEMRVRARNEKRIQDAKRGGSGAELAKAESDSRTDAVLTAQIHKNKTGRYGFIYKVEIQNSGTKAVKAVDWDYVFLDANTQEELGRRQFSSQEKIAAGKTRELKFFIPTPPTQKVSINSLDKDERANLNEAVVIVRIEYTDGSIWQHP
jgi:hypothetical protein